MKNLYAPWRSGYLKTDNSNKNICVFCVQANKNEDAVHFIIKRFEHCYVMLNLYPYNAGHVLIIPYEHNPSLETLPTNVQHELIDVTSLTIKALQKSVCAQGINVGMNIGGSAAGGSIPEHLHIHVIPRFHGDTNFLVTVADTKQISINLPELYTKLVQAFE